MLSPISAVLLVLAILLMMIAHPIAAFLVWALVFIVELGAAGSRAS